ncbi:hypothetical protein GCM10009827_118820 [Dactylosporangium maewongense]|uniref:Uncharacterized protein n=1 Tax=Dactylosporangium maewongense TaxID=634393 RepID=A0ABP4PDK3_9ACTN
MGYTHSWRYRPGSADYAAAWPQILTDVTHLLGTLQGDAIDLAGPQGYALPIIDPVDGIAFNGAVPEDYECFDLDSPGPDRPVWRFCKTDRRPYDLAVTAVLLRCHQLLPGSFLIGSDGSWDRDWHAARGVVRECFGAVTGTDPLCDTTIGLFPPVH